MPSTHVKVCYCGHELEQRGPNEDSLHCPHCDRPCTVLRDTKENCANCSASTKHWKDV